MIPVIFEHDFVNCFVKFQVLHLLFTSLPCLRSCFAELQRASFSLFTISFSLLKVTQLVGKINSLDYIKTGFNIIEWMGNNMMKNNSKKVKENIERVSYYHKPERMSHEAWQTKLRKQFALEQNYIFKNTGYHPVFSDFELTNPLSNRTYKVAIRSEEQGLNYCSCPDFKINTLGTCKHIEHVLFKLKQSPENQRIFKDGFLRQYSSITLKYGAERKVVLRIGITEIAKITELARKYFDENLILKEDSFDRFEMFLEEVVCLDPDFKCYKDAIDYIVEVRDIHKRKQLVYEAFPEGINSKLFDTLLKTNLYSYQKEGILFAAAAGRSLIADEMGHGKTIQAIGAMEVMFRLFRIERILIICPTSLKYQWKSEVEKFSGRQALVINGSYLKRKQQYEEDVPIKIVTYNSVARDLVDINLLAPDLVILDEAQRIKNWKTKLAKAIKYVNSQYAIVLTGTPLENRLEELHSIVEYIDRFKLGPLFKFLATHQLVEPGQTRVIGYKGLNKINETLAPILIRRNKKQVKMQLPERLEKIFFVPMTEEQMSVHEECREAVAKLIFKWRKFHFLSDKDRLQLLKQLGIMKMVCDSTYIINEDDRHDTKVDELIAYLKDTLETEDKVVVFSQYERMTRLVAKELEKIKIGYEYLHGGIPGDKRGALIKNFHEKPEVKVFLSTDAGGVGLNLQCAML